MTDTVKHVVDTVHTVVASSGINWNLWIGVAIAGILLGLGIKFKTQLGKFVDQYIGPMLIPILGPNYKVRLSGLLIGFVTTLFELVFSGQPPNASALTTAWGIAFTTFLSKGKDVHTLPSGQNIALPANTSVAKAEDLPVNNPAPTP